MVSLARKLERQQKAGRRVAIVLFAVFAIVGAGMLYPLGIRPVMKAFAAQNWQQIPCKIISGEVESHRGSKGGHTYSIDIVYEYEFADGKYRCDKYYFVGGSSSGYKNKARIVDEYKTAANPVCFVNPENPSEAVLVRGFHAGLLLGLVPGIFMLVGIGGLISSIKKTSSTGMQQQMISTDVLRLTDSSTGPVILKPKFSPKAKLIGSIVAAVVWNGIVLVFLVNMSVHSFSLFMIPFIIIGLALIGLVVYCVLASFNPRPTFIVNSSQIPTGSTAHLDWHLTGRIDRLKTLTITLRAKEEASYKAGKNQHTDTNIFFKKEIYCASALDIHETGQADFDIPADTMHSFESEHNKILWGITVNGSIEKWPDIREEYKITVTPAGTQRV